MNNQLPRRTFVLITLLPLLGPTEGWAADYRVIVHPTNPMSRLTREELGKIYLKKIIKWGTGLPIIPVDQAPDARVRRLFTRIVHRKLEGAIASYWQQQIFAGRALPPIEKADDAAVLDFLRNEPGASATSPTGPAQKGSRSSPFAN